jgi:hypothetical protein
MYYYDALVCKIKGTKCQKLTYMLSSIKRLFYEQISLANQKGKNMNNNY